MTLFAFIKRDCPFTGLESSHFHPKVAPHIPHCANFETAGLKNYCWSWKCCPLRRYLGCCCELERCGRTSALFPLPRDTNSRVSLELVTIKSRTSLRRRQEVRSQQVGNKSCRVVSCRCNVNKLAFTRRLVIESGRKPYRRCELRGTARWKPEGSKSASE